MTFHKVCVWVLGGRVKPAEVRAMLLDLVDSYLPGMQQGRRRKLAAVRTNRSGRVLLVLVKDERK